jgi:hypothetical protein
MIAPVVVFKIVEMKYIENDNAQILDALKDIYGVRSDRALTKKLDVSTSFVSAIRRGEKNFSRTKMLELESTLKHSGVIVTSALPESAVENSKSRVPNDDIPAVNRFQTRHNAAEKCELCDKDAPFKDKENSPYLEVIQIIPPEYGGTIALSNLAALCPNCAAKILIRGDSEDIQYLIQLKEKQHF